MGSCNNCIKDAMGTKDGKVQLATEREREEDDDDDDDDDLDRQSVA